MMVVYCPERARARLLFFFTFKKKQKKIIPIYSFQPSLSPSIEYMDSSAHSCSLLIISAGERNGASFGRDHTYVYTYIVFLYIYIYYITWKRFHPPCCARVSSLRHSARVPTTRGVVSAICHRRQHAGLRRRRRGCES